MAQTGLTRAELEQLIQDIFASTPGNTIAEQVALSPDCIGQVCFDAPIVKIGSADDPLFDELKQEGIVGPWHRSPKEWLPTARTVIAMFFPISEAIRASNRESTTEATNLWRHARHDGQLFQNAVLAALRDALSSRGFESVIPATDARFFGVNEGDTVEGFGTAPKGYYGSCWSERHASYVCGLGTFCLSKGLISEKGVAGRYSTLITDLPMDPDTRAYTGPYDNCSQCGACAARCPANAIDPVNMTKNHSLCFQYQAATRHVVPYGGCGLCQVGVPCEAGVPKK